ncbi:MAG: hypothetical protein AABZ12_04655 [Planctomycetota bacterium]
MGEVEGDFSLFFTSATGIGFSVPPRNAKYPPTVNTIAAETATPSLTSMRIARLLPGKLNPPRWKTWMTTGNHDLRTHHHATLSRPTPKRRRAEHAND